MENRAALRGAGISRGLVVLFAVIVVLGLGVMAAYVAKSFSAPAATTEQRIVATQPGPDAQERHDQAWASQYADDKPSTGHGQLP